MELYQVYQFAISHPIIKNTVLPALIASISTFISNYYLYKRAKIKINNQAEKIKYEMQRKYLFMEMRTTQLFKIYPELFSKFKDAESAILTLKFPIQGHLIPQSLDVKKAEDILIIANNFLAYNLLFLSNDIAADSMKLKNLFVKCLYCEDKTQSIQLYKQLEENIESLKMKMKKELESGLNIN